MSSFSESVAAFERDLDAVGRMWVELQKKHDACPEREELAPHAPEFGEMVGDMRCKHCGVPLVAL